MGVLWQALYGSYQLLVHRVGRVGAVAGIAGAGALAAIWLLLSPRALLPIVALLLLGLVWLWRPALHFGRWSRPVTAVFACLAILTLGLYVVDAPALAPPTPTSAPLCVGSSCLSVATNWSGYSVGGGPYSVVRGAFTVPTLAATPTVTGTAEWVGIGGVNTEGLIQAGVTEIYDPSTSSVDLQAWWEILPAPEVPISTVPVAPGDTVTVTIWRISGRRWGITLTDDATGGAPFTTVQTYGGPQAPADWIVEAPTLAGTVAPLGEYNPAVSFGKLGMTGSATTTTAYLMRQGGAIVAMPSALTSAGFTVAPGTMALEVP
ncbi:MAG: G1 family glutamic endopeptidase [Candidatus Limnocylindrales bacterium]